MTASTVTATKSLGTQLDQADPNTLADVLRQVQLGTILTPLKKTLTLSAFGLMVVLGFLAGSFVMQRLARREGIRDETSLETLFLLILLLLLQLRRA